MVRTLVGTMVELPPERIAAAARRAGRAPRRARPRRRMGLYLVSRSVLARAGAAASAPRGAVAAWRAGRVEPPLPLLRTEVTRARRARDRGRGGDTVDGDERPRRTDDPVSATGGAGLVRPARQPRCVRLRGRVVSLAVPRGRHGDDDRGRARRRRVARAAVAAGAARGRGRPRSRAGSTSSAASPRTARAARCSPTTDATRRWRTLPGPTRREHLAVAAARGRVYAIGGPEAGIDTNLALVESWAPGERRWRREPSLPQARGGTGAAVLGGRIVSVGGEAPCRHARPRLRARPGAPPLDGAPAAPDARHGLGVAAFGGRVYVIGGGRMPGLTVSDANESLASG